MKLKNSKYKNTGLIFELLSRQLVSDVMEQKNTNTSKIIKQYFKKGTQLSEELSLYKALAETVNISPTAIPKLIDIVLKERSEINNRKLKREKYNLIKDIREAYDIDTFFSMRVDSYKKLGNIYKLFENAPLDSPVDYAECHSNLVEQIGNTESGTTKSEQLWEKQDPAIKKIAFKLLIEKFNTKYKDLNTKQRTLVTKYINENIQSVEFKNYVYSEITQIKTKLNELTTNTPNASLEIKLNEVSGLIKNILTSNIMKEHHLSAMLKFYELIDVLGN